MTSVAGALGISYRHQEPACGNINRTANSRRRTHVKPLRANCCADQKKCEINGILKSHKIKPNIQLHFLEETVKHLSMLRKIGSLLGYQS